MASAGTKSSMMERLRRLRMASTAPQVVVPARRDSAVANTNNLVPLFVPRHRDEGLDLWQVNSKLEQYVRKHSRDKDESDESTGLEKEQMKAATEQSLQDAETSKIGGKSETKTIPKEQANSQRSASTYPSIVITPPDDEPIENPDPDDFRIFLQQAEVDEHLRKEQGKSAVPKMKQPTSLNPFYSNDLPSPSAPNKSKLAEISETGDQDDAFLKPTAKSVAKAEQQQQATAVSSITSSGQRTPSTVSSGSNDFAAADTEPTPVNTAGLGRHISFSEPVKMRERSASHSSAYQGRGCSPEPLKATRKRRGFRQTLKRCLPQF